MTPGRLALVVVASLLSVGVLGFLATRMMPSAPPELVSQEPAAQAPAPRPVRGAGGPHRSRRPRRPRSSTRPGSPTSPPGPAFRHPPSAPTPPPSSGSRGAARSGGPPWPGSAGSSRSTAPSAAARSADDGRSRTPILGPALDGDPFAAIRATPETSAWHGDPVWDHAVGPLQFIPSTWETWGTDADGDGVADPNDIDDAACAAVAYLCADGHDLTTGRRLGRRGLRLQPRPVLRRLGLRRGHGLRLADRVGISRVAR